MRHATRRLSSAGDAFHVIKPAPPRVLDGAMFASPLTTTSSLGAKPHVL